MKTAYGALLALCTLCACAGAQRHLFTFDGPQTGDRLGRSVTIPGDVNKDGYADILVGADQRRNNNQQRRGYARLYSGRDGSVLFDYRLPGLYQVDSSFGRSVSGAGDVNNDGYIDVVIGAWGYRPFPVIGRRRGAAVVFSGKDGKPIHTWVGSAFENAFGESVRGVGDINADGHSDVLVGAPSSQNAPGYVSLFCGKTGKELKRFISQAKRTDDDRFGFSVGAGDINGDLRPDILIGAPGEDVGIDKNVGAVYAFSGRDLTLIKRFQGKNANDWFGWAVDAGRLTGQRSDDLVASSFILSNNNMGVIRVFATRTLNEIATWVGNQGDGIGRSLTVASDLDKDGHADLLIGSVPDAPKPGFAGAISGKAFTDGNSTIQVICGRLYVGQQNSDFYALAVGAGGDINADGWPDVVIGAIGTNNQTGSAFAMSCKDLELSTDTHVVSIAAGGTQRMSLRGPANRSYLILGTLSGSLPGTQIGSVRVPLNFDAYTWFSIPYPTLFITGGAGTFDRFGTATATFRAGSRIPAALAGGVMHHAYVVLGPQPVSAASNAAPLMLTK